MIITKVYCLIIIIMLNTKITSLTYSLFTRLLLPFSSYAVKEVRGDYLYVIEDKQQQLEYMREVETDDGRRGIVIKIEEYSSTYVAMYENIPKKEQSRFQVKQNNIPWQQSNAQVVDRIKNASNKPCIFNVQGNSILQAQPSIQIEKKSSQRRKLLSLSPILDICHQLDYGGMYNFSGCYGSKKTSTLTKVITHHNRNQHHLSLYYNPTSFSETESVVKQSGAWGFNNGDLKQHRHTEAGVYMLAVKVIHLAKQLSKEGWNVLLGVDNFKSLLQAEWHMLQLLTNTNRRNSGEFINYTAPKIAPISILNEIYASCNDFQRNKSKKSNGSFTSILITENNQKNDQQTPEITPYTNNLKHLASLVHKVDFPLSIKLNHKTSALPASESLDNHIRTIRKHINAYLQEKQQSELKRKLYKSDMLDAPWDYYAMLDCEWWLQGLQTIRISNQQQFHHLLTFLVANIQQDMVSHWKIPCLQAFKHYLSFLQRQSDPSLQHFVSWSKQEGHFSPFKKDYLN